MPDAELAPTCNPRSSAIRASCPAGQYSGKLVSVARPGIVRCSSRFRKETAPTSRIDREILQSWVRPLPKRLQPLHCSAWPNLFHQVIADGLYLLGRHGREDALPCGR